jgi:hypothetical protein
MMLYVIAIALHVVVAVLGVGIVGAVPITARFARRSQGPLAGIERVLAALLRAMQVGFLAMVTTGVLLDLSPAGPFHGSAWFKVSIAVLPLIGFSHVRAKAALRGGFGPGGAPDVALGRVERWGWVMCAAVALITVLMQVKPLS